MRWLYYRQTDSLVNGKPIFLRGMIHLIAYVGGVSMGWVRIAMSAATALLAAQLAMAADPPWKQEPATVMSIELGGPWEPLDSHHCPNQRGDGREVCWGIATYAGLPAGQVIHSMHNLPDLGFPYEASILTADERIASLSLSLDRRDFDRVVRILVERYGKPHKTADGTFANGTGAMLPARLVSWTGRRVRIVAQERVRLDRSSITFESIEIAGSEDAKSNASEKAAASRL
jgi:hypothetical protein